MEAATERRTLLAVDTATEACSAALLHRQKLYHRFAVAPQQHSHLIFEMCQSLLDEAAIGVADLQAIVYGRGPGTFTGVRIAASFVQGLAYAQHLAVVAISDLAAIALQALDKSNSEQVLVATDARMGEVYYGYFEKHASELVRIIGSEAVAAPQKLQVPDRFKGIGAGSAWPLYRAAIENPINKLLGERLSDWYAPELPRATTLLRLAIPQLAAGKTLRADEALPVYLRAAVAKTGNAAKTTSAISLSCK